MAHPHDDDHGDHSGVDGHGRGHHGDQGWRGGLRYLLLAPRMWRNVASAYVVDVAAPVEGRRVVDIGAGMGPAAVEAVQKGASVVAVEPTPFLRAVLRVRRMIQRRRKALAILDGVAERIEVNDESVDMVWAVNSVHHWQDLDAAAAEIARVLRADGRVILVDEDFDHPEHGRNKRRRRRHRHRIDAVDAHTMAGALAGAGLVDVEALDTWAADGVPVKRAIARKP